MRRIKSIKLYFFSINSKGFELGTNTSRCQPRVKALTNIILPAIKSIGKQHSAVVLFGRSKYFPDASAEFIMNSFLSSICFGFPVEPEVLTMIKSSLENHSFKKFANSFDIENLIKLKIVQGGMIPKIQNCIDAVENGVRGVVILDGRKPHSILNEIFSDQGAGTLIRK